MSRTTEKIVAFGGVGLLVFLAWFLPIWVGLGGALRWIVFAGLTLCAVGALLALWLLRWRKTGSLPAGPDDAKAGVEVDSLIREAETRLASSGKFPSSNVGDLPVIVLLGESGSAKTTTMIKSGLNADLLAGQAQDQDEVTPTKTLNLWLSGATVFADWGGSVLGNRPLRRHLIRRLLARQPILGRKVAALRAAVVCVDCERIVQPEGPDALRQSASNLRETLAEMCEAWGTNLPVYVVFTRLDRVAYFLDYAGALSNAEVAQALGASVSLNMGLAGGTYAEQATARLNEALQTVTADLENRRLDLLGRISSQERLPGAYQFPREFRKMRPVLLQFLVEMFRPSHLHTNPVLRGFYFTAVRPVVVSDIPAEARLEPEAMPSVGASGIFQLPPGALARMLAQPKPVVRKVPEWVFVSPLLSKVVLGDQGAVNVLGASRRVSTRRRLITGLVTTLAIVLAILWTVSWVNNRGLQNEVSAAAENLDKIRDESSGPSAAVLGSMAVLRAELVRLEKYGEEGPPFGYGFGLYSGDRLYEAARKVYFSRLRTSLLDPARRQLLGVMGQPQESGLSPDGIYNALKSYLMTTSHPEKADERYLAPRLREYWAKAFPSMSSSGSKAEEEFRYYARALSVANPLPNNSKPDDRSVSSARSYLGAKLTSESIYREIVNAANAKFAGLRFNDVYKGTAAVIVNATLIPGAFTKNGRSFMQQRFEKPFEGDEWVLSQAIFAQLGTGKLRQELRDFYSRDFKNAWRGYVAGIHVVEFSTPTAAAAQLTKLTDFDSPLLRSVCLATENVSGADKEILATFQPVLRVEPQVGCLDKLADPANEKYRTKMTPLRVAFLDLSANVTSDTARQKAREAASDALTAVGDVAGDFQSPHEEPAPSISVAKEMQRVLEEPIRYARESIESAALEPANAAGADTCRKLNEKVLSKYPFNPSASTEAQLSDLNEVFAPGEGIIWQFYEKQMAKYMPRPSFSPMTVESVRPNPSYVTLIQKAAALTSALYRTGAPPPQFVFTLKPVPSDNVQSVVLDIYGQTERTTPNSSAQFTWPGKAMDVRMSVVLSGGSSSLDYPTYSGLWALARFFAKADGGSHGGHAEFTLTGGAVTSGGRPVKVAFDNPPLLFLPGSFSGMQCGGPALRKIK